MKYLFDASAIFALLKPETIAKLGGNYTIELAKFEIGNIIWKERAIYRRMNETEQKALNELGTSALKTMQVLKIDGHENDVLGLASEIHDSFYGASYAHIAEIMSVPLVTGDSKLLKKILGRINVKTVNEI